MTTNVLVLVGGGHASGKRTVVQEIKSELETTKSSLDIVVVDMRDFLHQEEETLEEVSGMAITVGEKRRLDLQPQRFNFQKLTEHVAAQMALSSNRLVLVHGLYALWDAELCRIAQIKVFVAGDADTRLIRWIRRDVLPEGSTTTLDSVLNFHLCGAKQEMSEHILPTKERADIIMPRGADANAILLIVDGIMHYEGTQRITTPAANTLRPEQSPFQKERFDQQKGKYYELT